MYSEKICYKNVFMRTSFIINQNGLGNGFPDSKVHGANMGPIWGLQDPSGPHVGPMNFAIWDGAIRLWAKVS